MKTMSQILEALKPVHPTKGGRPGTREERKASGKKRRQQVRREIRKQQSEGEARYVVVLDERRGYDDEPGRGEFQDPGGRSALRRARRGNPRNLPCPTCGQPNKLTPQDKARGYQCDDCADREEGAW